jgi:hypothetical protein
VTLVLDSGGLIAIERHERSMWEPQGGHGSPASFPDRRVWCARCGGVGPGRGYLRVLC